MSELLRLQRFSTGKPQWIKSCKPAIGNHMILSPNSISKTFPVKTKNKAPTPGILFCSSAGHASFQSSSREENRGSLLGEPFRWGVSESSDTIEQGIHPFQGNYFSLITLSTCCIFLHHYLLPGVFP